MFPPLPPSSRQIEDLSFPVKTYNAQNGKEVRLNYGDRGFGLRMSLTYQNINDSEAEQFLTHYRDQQGTFEEFEIPRSETSPTSGILAGYLGDAETILGTPSDTKWRYAQAPAITHEFRGRSTVRINLVSVMAG